MVASLSSQTLSVLNSECIIAFSSRTEGLQSRTIYFPRVCVTRKLRSAKNENRITTYRVSHLIIDPGWVVFHHFAQLFNRICQISFSLSRVWQALELYVTIIVNQTQSTTRWDTLYVGSSGELCEKHFLKTPLTMFYCTDFNIEKSIDKESED